LAATGIWTFEFFEKPAYIKKKQPYRANWLFISNSPQFKKRITPAIAHGNWQFSFSATSLTWFVCWLRALRLFMISFTQRPLQKSLLQEKGS